MIGCTQLRYCTNIWLEAMAGISREDQLQLTHAIIVGKRKDMPKILHLP